MRTKISYIRLSLLLTVSLIPIITLAQVFTGPTDVCKSESNTYTYYDDVQYSTVSWSTTGGGSIVSGSGLSRVIQWSAPGSVTVILRNANNVIVSQDTKNVTVFIPGTVSASLSTICSGQQVQLQSTGHYAATLTWMYSTNGGSTWTSLGSGGAAITQQPNVTTWYKSYVCQSRFAYNNSNVVQVTVNASPAIYSISGGGSYCSGGSGLTVSLSGSQSGMNYQLKKNGVVLGATVSGTGGVLNWNVTDAGVYTITAVNGASGGCATEMSGSATVIVDPLTDAGTVSPALVEDYGISSGSLTLSAHIGTIQRWGTKFGQRLDGNCKHIFYAAVLKC